MNTTANFFRKGEKRMGITAYLPVYWLIALVVFLVIEAATLGLATIWFAGGALVALIAFIGFFRFIIHDFLVMSGF